MPLPHTRQGGVCLGNECLQAPDGRALQEAVHAALAGNPAHLSCLSAWSSADWASLRVRLLHECAAGTGRAGAPLSWRLALPKNHVVAVKLTDEMLAGCLAHLGVQYRPGSVLHREETYSPGYCEFRAGDYAISDVAAAGSGAFFSRAGTHDRAWVWKPLNKARGERMRVNAELLRLTH